MKALINIDYTNDFIAEEGALSVGEPGRAIESEVVKVTKQFVDNGDFVVFAVDVHDKEDPYHPENSLFPPHNLRNTEGRHLYGALGEYYNEVKENPQVYFMDKTRYSAFVGTDLDIKLRERGITEVHLIGDVTDICVLHTAIYAYSLQYKIVIHQQAVASFNQAGHEWALEHFQQSLGATIR
ncbi:cysteine hydrolase family protein [Alkalicoccobacillus porphyridii]|uniref:Cysteine hydrolase n=1 Tax=Alkalicoccobacillus porphyridii TaxID=2597270 RepID=A0A554A0I7_9BACI|nr:isochorismatase family cysteine hydrolase [Alkalicoccobacillus porphyridii]TSB47210.1 cysteine hydrolase [Alkalicoccobacillus porphyridii]